MEHGARAKQLFLSGYNCAQSVFLAYQEEVGLDEATMLRLSSVLGGGMGGLREMCGAVSGMFLVMGQLYGYDDVTDKDAKAALYRQLQAMAHAFEGAHGSFVCRELLGLPEGATPAPSARTQAYYQDRPCAHLVESAARLLDEYMAENPPATEVSGDGASFDAKP
ncbi:MAG: C-GCAxxG-C-C family protein [Clostridia bacterium]